MRGKGWPQERASELSSGKFSTLIPSDSRWLENLESTHTVSPRHAELGKLLRQHLLRAARFMYGDVYMLQKTDIFPLNIL